MSSCVPANSGMFSSCIVRRGLEYGGTDVSGCDGSMLGSSPAFSVGGCMLDAVNEDSDDEGEEPVGLLLCNVVWVMVSAREHGMKRP